MSTPKRPAASLTVKLLRMSTAKRTDVLRFLAKLSDPEWKTLRRYVRAVAA